MTVVLGNDDAFFAFAVLDGTYRRIVRQIVGTDNDTASVYADLPIGVFQLLGVCQHGRYVFVLIVEVFLKFRQIFVAVFEVDLW